MRRAIKILFLILVAITFTTGSAFAYSVSVLDPDDQTAEAANWPGYYNPPTVGYYFDTWGGPKVSSLKATIDSASGYLQTIQVYMDEYAVNWDYKYHSLFINTDLAGNYEEWDYYVKENKSGYAIYDISAGYTYLVPTPPEDYKRLEHPVGVDLTGMGALDGYLESVVWGGGALTYTFSKDMILMGDQFAIGFTEWCANDVALLTTVPEPAILMLLGLGLLGIGIIRRKK